MNILKKINLSLLALVFAFLPKLTFAATAGKVCNTTIADIGDILCKVSSLLQTIIPIIITLGIVYFVWGVVSFVIGDDEEAKTKGRDRMIYGIIGFVVMGAMWGLVTIVINTFGLDQGTQLVSNLVNNNSAIVGANAGSCSLSNNSNLADLFNYVTCMINKSIIPLIFSLTMVMFIWGVVQFVINDDEEAKKEKGKQFMIWGIIGITVMVSVWGLVKIVGTTFNIDTTFIPQVKQ